MFRAGVEFCLHPQIRLGAHPTRSCGFKAVHWPLQPLAAHTDVPEVLPRRACLWRGALCQMCPGCAFWNQCRSGARTLSAPQDGPCRFHRQRWPIKRMITLEADWILRETWENPVASHLICFCRNSSVQTLAAVMIQCRQDQLQPSKTTSHEGLFLSVFHSWKGDKMKLSLGFLFSMLRFFFFSVLVLCEVLHGILFNHSPTTGNGGNTVGNPYLIMKYI